ncbi:MAG: C4-dicarboxylate ABC transporter substrate-binding protein [Deltaproteobacteria bacterium RBG_13_43_22]|nr:MAG: C4-dicarboxylate ABC transporter substrate-binding protein [Deltaproteobacteria bacterium RBG_13_43_22]
MKEEDRFLNRRDFLKISGAMGLGSLIGFPTLAMAQTKVRLSIVTGGTGGVYYPYGGGMAAVLSKHLPGVEVTAEVTAASVDNCKLVAAQKADLGFVMGDSGHDAYMGSGKFKEKLPLRNLAVLYSNFMHIVTLEGKGINTVSDLKGKRISTGAPGSGTEVKGLRVLEAYGINPEKDISRDRLGATESAGALKDRKIDAYFWDGGLPTASILDLAATPGIKAKLIGHEDGVGRMIAKYGPVYFKGKIPKNTYPGIAVDTAVAAVANILICHEKMDPALAYNILKTLFAHKPELVTVHKEANNLTLEDAVDGSPIPFHPGASKFYKEKGLKF